MPYVSSGCQSPIIWLFFFWVKIRELLLGRNPSQTFLAGKRLADTSCSSVSSSENTSQHVSGVAT
jgi:hypothetical protein